MTTWLLIIGMAIVSYAARALPRLVPLPNPSPVVERALRFMPPATFAR